MPPRPVRGLEQGRRNSPGRAPCSLRQICPTCTHKLSIETHGIQYLTIDWSSFGPQNVAEVHQPLMIGGEHLLSMTTAARSACQLPSALMNSKCKRTTAPVEHSQPSLIPTRSPLSNADAVKCRCKQIVGCYNTVQTPDLYCTTHFEPRRFLHFGSLPFSIRWMSLWCSWACWCMVSCTW